MAKPGRAYFVDGVRYTPSRFRRLSRTKKVEGMVEWFGRHFEDPVHRTSYVSAEGGYLWNHGGPFDATEELVSEFGDIVVEEDLIEEAVQEIEDDGTTEWASSSDDDYDPPEDENDGIFSINEPLPDLAFERSPENEADYLQELINRLDQLEGKLDAYAAQRARRGHNHPPELVDEELLSDVALAETREAVATIRQEVAKEEPDEVKVEQAAGILKRIGRMIWGGAKKLAADARAGVVGYVAVEHALTYVQGDELATAAMDVASAATRWVHSLPSFW